MNTLFRAGVLTLAITAGGAVAHGDEPHGDAPHPPAVDTAAGPHFEASTALFEVVGRLEDGALTLWVNRFATGEPVAGAAVDVELGAQQASARYRADRGDYAVDDAAFVAALATPGPHPLVLTVTAGDEADLLDATVAGAAAPPAPEAGASPNRLAAGALLAAATVAGLGVFWRRRRRAASEVSA